MGRLIHQIGGGFIACQWLDPLHPVVTIQPLDGLKARKVVQQLLDIAVPEIAAAAVQWPSLCEPKQGLGLIAEMGLNLVRQCVGLKLKARAGLLLFSKIKCAPDNEQRDRQGATKNDDQRRKLLCVAVYNGYWHRYPRG